MVEIAVNASTGKKGQAPIGAVGAFDIASKKAERAIPGIGGTSKSFAIVSVEGFAPGVAKKVEKGEMEIGEFREKIQEFVTMASEGGHETKAGIASIIAEEIRRPIGRMVGKVEGAREFYDAVNKAIHEINGVEQTTGSTEINGKIPF